MSTMPITDIKVGKRHRRDMGDIKAFATNVREIGILQPVVVTPAGKLIAGERVPERPARVKTVSDAVIGNNPVSRREAQTLLGLLPSVVGRLTRRLLPVGPLRCEVRPRGMRAEHPVARRLLSSSSLAGRLLALADCLIEG